MKIYNHKAGILIEKDHRIVLVETIAWDEFINQDKIFEKAKDYLNQADMPTVDSEFLDEGILPPLESQEIWGSGVTYYNSKMARQEESQLSGGADFYARVYNAERPELFYKANKLRTVGHKQKVRIRKDSEWNVPEPELTLVINSKAEIIGYTIGNDMSSRSIEGENPLYLPQAKTYDGSAAIGPCIYLTDTGEEIDEIQLKIKRGAEVVFSAETRVNQIVRKYSDLVHYLFRECSFPYGVYLMTGTGIIPPPDFTLASGDKISITIHPIGTLVNFVA